MSFRASNIICKNTIKVQLCRFGRFTEDYSKYNFIQMGKVEMKSVRAIVQGLLKNLTLSMFGARRNGDSENFSMPILVSLQVTVLVGMLFHNI